MFKFLAALGFGALVALTAFDATAQTAAAPTSPHQNIQRPGGSYRAHTRWRRTQPRDRARASAEHMRQLRSQ